MKGKDKCRILKDIRRQIAEKNDIEWVVSECTHKGECKGTCPKCESEVRRLERELRLRRQVGKTVAIAGVSAACMAGLTACSLEDVVDFGTSVIESVKDILHTGQEPEIIELDGDVPYYDPEDDIEVLDGEVASIEYIEDDLSGYVAYDEACD